MTELGLFPLGVVLLPTEQIPLHIFEDRYRELIGECLADGREFGLVFADEDGIREIGTRAAVTEVLERFDDDVHAAVVEGRERFRLLELTGGRSFHTGVVEPLEDEGDDDADPHEVRRALRLFDRLVELTGSDVEPPEPRTPLLSFALAARFELAPELKQRLLVLRSERERVTLLVELLDAAARSVARQREVAERAATNGKVEPRG